MLVLSVGLTLAWLSFRDVLDDTNGQTGKVVIETSIGDDDVVGSSRIDLLASNVISGTPLTNEEIYVKKADTSVPCYIRVKVMLTTLDSLTELEQHWIDEVNATLVTPVTNVAYVWSESRGGFYYLLTPANDNTMLKVSTISTYSFATSITIPYEASMEYQQTAMSINLKLCIEVQSIQAKYITVADGGEVANINNRKSIAEIMNSSFNEEAVETYVVSYETNGGTTIKPTIIKDGITPTLPVSPTKESYEFVGWFRDASLTVAYNPATYIYEKNITVYAKWNRLVDLKFKYMSNEDTLAGALDVDGYYPFSAVTFPVVQNPANTNVTLIWFTENLNFNSTFYVGGSTATINADTTFYGAWFYTGKASTDFVSSGSLITKCNALYKSIYVPSLVTGNASTISAVQGIFNDNQTVERVLFATTITNIKSNSFVKCTLLKNLSIPSTVTTIETDAIKACVSLRSISIGTSTGTGGTIQSKAIRQCSILTELTINSSVTSILGQLTEECYALSVIRFTATNYSTKVSGVFTGLNAYAQAIVPNITNYNSGNWLNAITFKTVQSNLIGYDAYDSAYLAVNGFAYMLGIKNGSTSINIPDLVNCGGYNYRVTGLGDRLTFNCYTTLKTVSFNRYLESIGKYCFAYTTQPLKLNLVSTIKKIDEYAFYQSAIEQIDYANDCNLENIGNYAFYSCTKITSFVLPNKLKIIGTNAFTLCNLLKTINCYSSNSMFTTVSTTAFVNVGNALSPANSYNIHVPAVNFSALYSGKLSFIANKLLSFESFTVVHYFDENPLKATIAKFGNIITLPARTLVEPYLENPAMDTYSWNTQINDCGVSVMDTSVFGANYNSTRVYVITVLVSTPGLAFAYNSGSATYVVTGYTGTAVEVTVPNRYNDGVNGKHPVFSIGANAFENNTTIVGLNITSGIQSFGQAFASGCTNLQYVVLPSNTTIIDSNSFYACINLSNINIPSSVAEIGEHAFQECQNIKSITIPSSTEVIRINAFAYCSSLKTVSIGSGLTWLESCAFLECSSLTSITLPFSLSYFGTEVFGRCTSLERADLSKCVNIDYVPINTFGNCSSLNTVILPNNITSIDELAFFGNLNLVSCNAPTELENIGTQAFYNCNSLTNFNLNDCTNLNSIGEEAFYLCSLAFIDLDLSRTSATFFGANCFYACNSMKSFISSYASNSSGESGIFGECYGLENVEINSNGFLVDYAFISCTALKSVSLNTTDIYIGVSAFSGCISLNTILIPSSISVLNPYCFSESGLEEIDLFACVITEIPEFAFSYCTDLISVSLPANLDAIYSNAFEFCDKLTNITLPSTLTNIYEYAFCYCSSLQTITIPASVTTMGPFIFQYIPTLIIYTSVAAPQPYWDPLWNSKDGIEYFEVHYNV